MKLGEPWRPYRSVACWYLWQSLRMDRSWFRSLQTLKALSPTPEPS